MKNPSISVVMPVYNSEQYLKESVESILNQSFTDFEFIIMNDGSTDNSAEIIKGYLQDSRIKFIDSKENKGNYARRNEGNRLSKGKYICVMDADDIAFTNRLEVQYTTMENNPTVIACGSAYLIMQQGFCYRPQAYELIKVMLIFNNMFLHPSLIIRKDVLEEIGFYNEKFYFSADYDLMCRLSVKGKVINLTDILMKYRKHTKQISTEHQNTQSEFANAIRLKYLKRCGIILNPAEEKLITKVMSQSEFEEGITELNVLFNNIIQQNNKISFFKNDLLHSFFESVIDGCEYTS